MAGSSSIKTASRVWHTKLCPWGTSQGIRIPKDVCEEIGIATGDKLDVTVRRNADGASILIKSADAKHRRFATVPRISLNALFADYQGSYSGEELDWGDDVGAEVVR